LIIYDNTTIYSGVRLTFWTVAKNVF